MADGRHLGFLKVPNFNCEHRSEGQYGLNIVSVPNFASVGQTIAVIWPVVHFPRWWPSAILDWLYACL